MVQKMAITSPSPVFLSPGGTFMVQKMAITSPAPSFMGKPFESGWHVYGPENGYNFP